MCPSNTFFSISQDFYQKNMKQIQDKLKECAQAQTMSMESLERLSKALHKSNDAMEQDDAEINNIDNSMLTEEIEAHKKELQAAKKLKGENKAPRMQFLPTKKGIHKKSARTKKKTRSSKSGATPEKKEKKKPRYFVQF